MDVYLRDQGWSIKTVREELGAGRSDDSIVELAKRNGFVVVTTDRMLVKRWRLLNITVIELGVVTFAEVVNRRLTDAFPPESK